MYHVWNLVGPINRHFFLVNRGEKYINKYQQLQLEWFNYTKPH